MSRMVAFVPHPPFRSSPRSISAQNTSTKLISGIHPKSRLGLMVFPDIAEKEMISKAPLRFPQHRYLQACLFSPKGAFRKRSQTSVENGLTHIGSHLHLSGRGGIPNHPSQIAAALQQLIQTRQKRVRALPHRSPHQNLCHRVPPCLLTRI